MSWIYAYIFLYMLLFVFSGFKLDSKILLGVTCLRSTGTGRKNVRWFVAIDSRAVSLGTIRGGFKFKIDKNEYLLCAQCISFDLLSHTRPDGVILYHRSSVVQQTRHHLTQLPCDISASFTLHWAFYHSTPSLVSVTLPCLFPSALFVCSLCSVPASFSFKTVDFWGFEYVSDLLSWVTSVFSVLYVNQNQLIVSMFF